MKYAINSSLESVISKNEKMNRYKYLITISLFLFTTMLQSQTQPNIIMIYADDLGWKDLSCTGSEYYETPNLDLLAKNGMRFTRAYAAAPVCAPSRGALLSGRSPARNKYTNIYKSKSAPNDSLYDVSKEIGLNNQTLEAKHRHTLGSEAILIAEQLKNAGYTTGFIGKWHIGILDGYRPEQRGYDWAAGYYNKIDVLFEDHYITNTTDLVNLPNAKPGDWREDCYVEAACSFIEDNKSKPFFLSYHSYLTHGPFVGKKELIGKYDKKLKTDQNNPKYASMVEALDESVGKIVAYLKHLKLLNNTLIVFSSDNGGCGATSNYPLMGGKTFSYEGGYRVPLIMHWPDKIKGGALNQTRTISMDLYPTFLEVANAPINSDYIIDGVSLVGEITQTSKLAKRPIYFHFPHYSKNTSPHSSVIYDGWKLTLFYNDAKGRYALFNLNDDPEEQNDKYSDLPEKVKELDKMLQNYLVSANAELPIYAHTPEGKDLIERYHNGNIMGDSENIRDNASQKNKESGRKKALNKRLTAEKNIRKAQLSNPTITGGKAQ